MALEGRQSHHNRARAIHCLQNRKRGHSGRIFWWKKLPLRPRMRSWPTALVWRWGGFAGDVSQKKNPPNMRTKAAACCSLFTRGAPCPPGRRGQRRCTAPFPGPRLLARLRTRPSPAPRVAAPGGPPLARPPRPRRPTRGGWSCGSCCPHLPRLHQQAWLS